MKHIRAVAAATAAIGMTAAGLGSLPARAQDAAPVAATKTIIVDDFAGPLAGWTALKIVEGADLALDNESRVTVAEGALRYSYGIAPKTLRVLALARSLNLAGMQSVRFRVRSDAATALVLGLNETGNVPYQAAFYCPAGSWQEVAFNLDEFVADDPGKDPNRKLDLDQIQSLHVADVGNLLVSVVPTLEGARTLQFDDIVFSAARLPTTAGVVREGAPDSPAVYRVDNFESPLIRWMPFSLELSSPPRLGVFDASLSRDAGALKVAYARKARRAQGLIRNLEKVDLKRARGLSLRLRSERDGLFVLAVQEKDGSRYQQIIPVQAAEGWTELSCALSAFTLAEDSADENDTLDAAEIKEIGIADITALLPEGDKPDQAANTLRLDDVQFSLRP